LTSASQNNIHFSQFYNVPLYLNPANAGNFSDLFRFNAIVRRQWSGLQAGGANDAFAMQTMGLGIDLNLGNSVGAGLMVISDQTGSAIFNTTIISPTLSKHFNFKNKRLSFGIQPSYTVAQVDVSKVRFFQLEPNDFQSSSYFDLGLGVKYIHDFDNLTFHTSFAVDHLLGAKQSFLVNGSGQEIPKQFKGALNIEWEPLPYLQFIPGYYIAWQANATNMLYGSNVAYKIPFKTPFGSPILIGGLWGRSNRANLESIIPKIGLKYASLIAMFSYDYHVNLRRDDISSFTPNNVNTIELSVIYTFKPASPPPLNEFDYILNPRF
jgi:type IX secretion system PorP/SprF family membrane protein